MATRVVTPAEDAVTYLSQVQAQAVDTTLMGALGFSLDQLMELAGLSVASALQEQYPLASHSRVLVVCGPGNNGGDGLVAARHLHHFGYTVQVVYPREEGAAPLYCRLLTQIRSLGVAVRAWQDVQAAGALRTQFDVVVDAVFGFSFKGVPRAPFDTILKALCPSPDLPALLSVDVPSGWDVELGDVSGTGLRPNTLVSLTAPKMGTRNFQGDAHFLGGRFIPPAIREQFSLQLPAFPGAAQHVRLSGAASPSAQQALRPQTNQQGGNGHSNTAATAAAAEDAKKVADMRISYTRGGLHENDMAPFKHDPMKAWATWFAAAVEGKVCEEPNAISVASVDPATGQPSVRVVLLKGFDERGFVFYTNYNSRKGQELITSGKAAFCVYWEALQRQVRVEGSVEKVSSEESSTYYHSRPRGSQVGAWVSNQSQPIASREALEQRAAELESQYGDSSVEVPLPAHWGGLLIRPTAIEFWQGRPSRLHDRIRFVRAGTHVDAWSMERLQP